VEVYLYSRYMLLHVHTGTFESVTSTDMLVHLCPFVRQVCCSALFVLVVPRLLLVGQEHLWEPKESINGKPKKCEELCEQLINA
jgi:hypothetical protein